MYAKFEIKIYIDSITFSSSFSNETMKQIKNKPLRAKLQRKNEEQK